MRNQNNYVNKHEQRIRNGNGSLNGAFCEIEKKRKFATGRRTDNTLIANTNGICTECDEKT